MIQRPFSSRAARASLAFLAIGLAAGFAQASFHVMQIEQVIGGVNGDTTAQAIQLRMRSLGQNFVASGRLNVRDATGSNPILIVDLTTNVPNGAMGSRVLIVSAGMAGHLNPNVTPNFTMTNTIPASYLSAGSLTFEDDFGTIYWRLSWGGAAYTGSNAGSITNDSDGNFGPPFAGALPSSTRQALRFPGTAAAPSTNNAADYSVTSGPATFTNNAGSSGNVVCPQPSIDSQPSDVTVDAGQPASLTVAASVGSLSFQWRKGGLALIDGGTVSGSTTATLTIDPTVVDDTGSYTVDVINGCGTVTSNPVTLTVNGAPPCVGDVDGDNSVGLADLSVLLAHFGTTGGATLADGDLNADGDVNLADLAMLLGNFGASCQ